MNPNRKIKVLIVDDSKVSRELMHFIITADPQLEVIAYAESGESALTQIQQNTPDVITMDIVMPRMDGFEATRRIMQRKPIPIVIVSSIVKKDDVANSFKSIEAGALAILPKPVSPADPKFTENANAIRETVKRVSEVRLITRLHTVSAAAPPTPNIPLPTLSRKFEAVAIGASLGGPQALQKLLLPFPEDYPLPIYLVQHIALGFVQGLAEWLGSCTRLEVKVAKNGETGKPGTVYIAPDSHHMQILKGHVIKLTDDLPDHGLMPSAGHLFRSIAKNFGPNAVGIILTGMGRDGVDDLLLMKQSGAYTIAQSEEGCLMYGMPREAILNGAAVQAVPLDQMSKFILELTGDKLWQKR